MAWHGMAWQQPGMGQAAGGARSRGGHFDDDRILYDYSTAVARLEDRRRDALRRLSLSGTRGLCRGGLASGVAWRGVPGGRLARAEELAQHVCRVGGVDEVHLLTRARVHPTRDDLRMTTRRHDRAYPRGA